MVIGFPQLRNSARLGQRGLAEVARLTEERGITAEPGRRSRSAGAGRGHRPCPERLQTLLTVAGVCWLERILDADPGVLLAGVEILRIEESASDLGRAADDHGVPE